MADAPNITLRQQGKLSIITLDMPSSYNAMTSDAWKLLGQRVAEADRNDAVATVVLANGKFFSAGANVKESRPSGPQQKDYYLSRFATGNAELARSLYEHRKILIVGLQGPAVGLSAALVALFDFIYAVPEAYIFTPFTALGLVAEGMSSQTFAQRLGPRAAREALLFGKRLSAQALFECGFVNKIFPQSDDRTFHQAVLAHVEGELSGLDEAALLVMKRMIRDTSNPQGHHAANLNEIFAAVERFEGGVPQRQFAAIANKTFRHKL